MLMGSLRYMAPEQARDARAADARADIYGLGAILFHVLTGDAPFRGDSVLHVIKGVVTDQPEIPDGVEIQPAMRAIVLKALAKAQGERYADMPAFRADLERFVAGERPLALGEIATRKARSAPDSAC